MVIGNVNTHVWLRVHLRIQTLGKLFAHAMYAFVTKQCSSHKLGLGSKQQVCRTMGIDFGGSDRARAPQ